MGVDPSNIVTRLSDREIPEATFDNFQIENLFNVSFINNLNMSNIFRNRLLVNTSNIQVCTGTYFLDNLEIKGELFYIRSVIQRLL